MRKYIIVAAILSFIWVSGCIPSKPSSEEVETIPSERLVKKLEANRRKVKSFEGSGTLVINTAKINTSANFKIWLHKPDSIYLEIYGPFGIDLAQALVTNNNFQFFDAMHNTLYRGRTNSDVLNKIFKVNMSFNDLLDAFVGAVNMNSRLSGEPDKYEIDYDKYVLTYNDSTANTKSKYRIGVKDLAISGYQVLNSKNSVVLEGKYSDFKVIENIYMPFAIALRNAASGQSIEIDYKKVDINKKARRFNIEIPEDATRVDL